MSNDPYKVRWLVLTKDTNTPAAQFYAAPDASSLSNTLGEWFRENVLWAKREFCVLRLDEDEGTWKHYANFKAGPPKSGAIIKGFPSIPQKFK